MPHRVSKGGSYRIDREIPGPGVKIQAFMRHTNQRMTDRYRRQKDRGEVATAVADAMLRSA